MAEAVHVAGTESDDRETMEVAECPYGCGELHEVTRLLGSCPLIACVRASSMPMFIKGFGPMPTRVVRLATRKA